MINEYINKKFGSSELESELIRLVGEYNKLRNTCLLVYAASTEKQIPLVQLLQSDFYTIRDLLSSQIHSHETVDVYLETPGGRGEAAEEIVRFLHSKFRKVSFVVAGEAKSAGTIMALGGNEILMTDTGSLGPIDAQMQVGRSVVSARDYIEWVEEKRKAATKDKMLNPFDATIVAQITPGELNHALHALEFAKDLVVDWLPQYKFANWQVTETRGLPVTDEMKRQRARKIADGLTDRKRWRTHGRSINIKDLESDEIGLKITHIDNNPELAEIVYRIQTVCRLLFDSSAVFKIFATDQHKIFRQASPAVSRPMAVPPQPGHIIIEPKCPKCGNNYRIYAKLADDPNIDVMCKKQGLTLFPKEGKIKCPCGFEIDLWGVKKQIEIEMGRKLITG